eukprot:CAMPEP_0201586514 /NCGR_PEP_ID=MMETSP0190_2-20130828/133727_1 /ASSEMBLY_ACC=CAM_ASM_000263 /TAXON_ID=37353 /ORGANISM="Rosalina sp." /LENGTH=245 /DNA_ID=CAMNT_0048034691 /DNA_START=111 /DNA_END=848 /DNA_ORIENTATION=-
MAIIKATYGSSVSRLLLQSSVYDPYTRPINAGPRQYEVIPGLVTYAEAQQKCQDVYGTTLATIEFDHDATNLLTTLQNNGMTNTGWWIGLNDLDTQSIWKYDSGYDCNGNCDTQSYWRTGEPNNNAERCVELNALTTPSINEMFNDYDCDADSDGAICDCVAPIDISGEYITANGLPTTITQNCKDGKITVNWNGWTNYGYFDTSPSVNTNSGYINFGWGRIDFVYRWDQDTIYWGNTGKWVKSA